MLSNLDLDIEPPEIDLLIHGPDARAAGEEAADLAPAIDASLPTVGQSGDLWLLGSHCLLCDHAREFEDHSTLPAGDR